MKKTNLLAADRESLLKLWQCALRESDTANHLLLAEGHFHRQSIALHLFRAWHALASVYARQSGLPEPEFGSFRLERESELLAPMPAWRLSNWAPSFDSIRRTALVRPWHANAHVPDLKDLNLQARLLRRCLAAQEHRVMKFRAGGQARRFGLRTVLTAIAVFVVVVTVAALGRRLVGGLATSAHVVKRRPISETVNVKLGELGDPKPRGYTWDGRGNVVFGHRMVVSLDGIEHPALLSVSLDGNDRYLIRLIAASEQVGSLEVGPSQIGGLEFYILNVPPEATARGMDSIVIEVLDGDGSYSLGHLLFDQD